MKLCNKLYYFVDFMGIQTDYFYLNVLSINLMKQRLLDIRI